MAQTWLVEPDRRVRTPNRYAADHKWVRPVECVVLHYTAGYRRPPGDLRLPKSVAWLTDPDAKASAHFVVDEAAVWQLAPLEDRTWHAGGSASRWRGQSVNVRSIGIEIANLGLLFEDAAGELRDYWGRRYAGEAFRSSAWTYRALAGPDRWATVERLYREKGLQVPASLSWDAYPASQLRLVARLLEDLAARFPVLRQDRDRLVFHEETAPTRKLDPGPALWWRADRWRSELALSRSLSAP